MTVRRMALPLLLAAALVALAAPASAASTPDVERSAWFNAAAGGGLAAPQPTTEEGDLRITRAADTQAFATLMYLGEGSRASLDVVIREGSGGGTPDVVACPTVDAEWEDGGNQPMDAAPEVDCGFSKAVPVVSEDGSTLSFTLDGGFQVVPGTWSIALVPAPGGPTPGPPPYVPMPFSVDLAAPEVGAFTLEEAFALPALPETSDDPMSSDTTASDPGSAGGFAAGDLGSVPTTGGGTAELEQAPLDPAVAAPGSAATAPDVAAPATVPQPVALQRAAAGDDGDSRRLLALLVLAAGCVAVGYAAGQSPPGPRLIGGRARLAGAGAVATAAALAVPSAQDRPRGIGRFAKTRDAAPRRLR